MCAFFTHHTAAGKDDEEAAKGAGGADHPRQSDEEDDAEDVLDARQKDADQGAHAGAGSRCRRLGLVGVRGRRDRVRVVCQRVEQRRHLRTVLQLLLRNTTTKSLIKINNNSVINEQFRYASNNQINAFQKVVKEQIKYTNEYLYRDK